MIFELDEQTKKDLGVLPFKGTENSVFSIFDLTKSNGGSNRLFNIFNTPLNDISLLLERRKIIAFLNKNKFSIELDIKQFDKIEYYLDMGSYTLHDNFIDATKDMLSYKYSPDSNYYNIQDGIHQLYKLSIQLKNFLNTSTQLNKPAFFVDLENKMIEFIKIINENIKLNKSKQIKYRYINKLDSIFRKSKNNLILSLLEDIYTLDAYLSVSESMDKNKFTFAEYLTSNSPYIKFDSLQHPFIKQAVSNDLEFGGEKRNLIFLTGPNMAGKSTFLKAIGISIYLSHIGFPVPSKEMKTTIFNGLNTTINLSDDIEFGCSHYFSEVKRVKQTSIKMRDLGNTVVIFDELFRGTNVKDALEASYKLMNEFIKIKNCLFIISSHINEISQYLTPTKEVIYKYFDSNTSNNKISYNYKLKNGISSERMGMKIIEEEQIFEILDEVKRNYEQEKYSN